MLADRRPAPLPVQRAAEVTEQTAIGRELVSGLVRAQLAASLRIAGVALLLFGPLPALFTFVPAAADLRLFGIPIAWWVLGLVAYPVLYVLAKVHRRQAERIEREFTELLDRG